MEIVLILLKHAPIVVAGFVLRKIMRVKVKLTIVSNGEANNESVIQRF